MTKKQLEKCPQCKKRFHSLGSHLLRSKSCGNILKKYSTKNQYPATRRSKPLNTSIIDVKEMNILEEITQGIVSETKHTHSDLCMFVEQTHQMDTFNDLKSISRDVIVTQNDSPQPHEDTLDHMEQFFCLNENHFLEETDMLSNEEPASEPISRGNDKYCDHLLLQHQQLMNNKHAVVGKHINFCAQLLKLINDTNSPLYLYEKIMDWAVHSVDNGFAFTKDYPSRKNLLKQMSQICCLDECLPLTKELKTSQNEVTTVNFFDFEQQCFSILTDQELMRDENLTFPHDNPCKYIRLNTDTLECIEDGDVFQATADSVCNYSNDFCLGIKLFIDATHTDVHSSWVLDPVMFTFTFFKNEVTRSSKAWRTLGFITDTDLKSRAQNSRIPTRLKHQDFHSQLKEIFSSVKKCQQKGGFMWNLRYRGKLHHVRMIPVIALVVGDAQGNHKLTGMYGKFMGVGRVNHSCDCEWKDTDNPNIKCNFVKASYVKRLCLENNLEELKKLSQHQICNAFDSVQLGVHDAGINALMPSEILHQLFLGIFQYTLTCFFDEYSQKALSRMDDFAKLLFKYGRHNSDRSIPSFHSRNGFTGLTKQSGTDKLSTCLVCLLLLSMDFNKSDFLIGCKDVPSERRREQYKFLFQEYLIYAEWLCSTKIRKSSLSQCHERIIKLMKSIKRLVVRESSVGWKICKFHEMLHTCRDITLFGPAEGYDGRPGESAHKWTKLNARKTQRRNDVFEKQTSQRMYDSLVIDTFHSHLRMYNPKFDCITKTKNISEKGSMCNGKSPHYFIYRKMDGDVTTSLVETLETGNDATLKQHLHVSNFLMKHLEGLKLDKIPCRSSIRWVDGSENIEDGDLIRCHPSINGSEWYDWAWFRWENNGEVCDVPGRIFCFIDLTDITTNQEELRKCGLKKSMYACIRSFIKPPVPTFSGSEIVFSGEFETIPQTYRIVDVEIITGCCYGLPNIAQLKDTEFEKWIILENRYRWGQKFQT